MNSVDIESVSAETLDVTVKSSSDPTGTTPEFAVTAVGTTSPSSFSNGSWGAYNSTTQKAVATTPTLGASGTATIALTEGTTYVLWLRVGNVVQRTCFIPCT